MITQQWDDTARVYRQWDSQPPHPLLIERPYTDEENAVADTAAAITAADAVRLQLATNTSADLDKLAAAIDSLALLLADNTTVGSIRAWKAPITNGQSVTGAQAKALADLLITETQATRRIARQVLRLARTMVGKYTTADVGTDL